MRPTVSPSLPTPSIQPTQKGNQATVAKAPSPPKPVVDERMVSLQVLDW